MANLTVTVDDELLRLARVKAVAAGTSVNALLREYLEAYAGPDLERARADLVDLARASTASSGPGGRQWTRDDLHER